MGRRGSLPRRNQMFDHIEFSVSSIATSAAFYTQVLSAIGVDELFSDSAAAGYGNSDVVALLISEGVVTTPSLHICFKAASKKEVEAAYERGLAAGGTCNGPPGYRDHYCKGYYAAFLFDPDGHNTEILFRET